MKTLIAIAALLFGMSTQAQEVKAVKVTELAKTIRESNGPLIVNFWATFCIPCLHEIPYFQELAEKYKPQGVSILFVSLDFKEAYPDSILRTARKHHIYEPIVWLNEINADYFCPKIDSAWMGNMPSTLFVNNTTGYRKFLEDQLSKEKLQEEIEAMIKPKS